MISISPAVLNPEDSNNFSSFPSLISMDNKQSSLVHWRTEDQTGLSKALTITPIKIILGHAAYD